MNELLEIEEADRAPARRPMAAALAFAAGLLTPFTVNLVGAMPVGELVLVGTVAGLFVNVALTRKLPGGLFRSRLLWVLIACQALAFLSYIVADVYRGSSPHDMARGWARMIFLAIDVVAIAYLFGLSGTRAAFLSFQCGYIAGMCAAAALGDVLFGDYWKFGFAMPVTLAVFLLVPRLGFFASLIACVAMGAVHFALDFRSLGAICLLVPGCLVLQRISPRLRLLVLPLCLAVAAGGVAYFYQGGRTEDAAARGSRSDIERTAMLQAAWEGFLGSPVIGQGSWFSRSDVMNNFFDLRYEKSVLSGVGSFSAEDETAGGIAIHSQVLVGLAEGGALGGCFFIVYGALLLWALLHCALRRDWHPLSALDFLLLMLGFWGLCMSPFSGMHRVLIASAAGLVLLLWREKEESQPGRAPDESDELLQPEWEPASAR